MGFLHGFMAVKFNLRVPSSAHFEPEFMVLRLNTHAFFIDPISGTCGSLLCKFKTSCTSIQLLPNEGIYTVRDTLNIT